MLGQSFFKILILFSIALQNERELFFSNLWGFRFLLRRIYEEHETCLFSEHLMRILKGSTSQNAKVYSKKPVGLEMCCVVEISENVENCAVQQICLQISFPFIKSISSFVDPWGFQYCMLKIVYYNCSGTVEHSIYFFLSWNALPLDIFSSNRLIVFYSP